LPDRFIDQGSPEQMYHDAELTADHIATAALQALGVEALSKRANRITVI
jgi:1-deoxy-D-xylulose-5-phosphate synthase